MPDPFCRPQSFCWLALLKGFHLFAGKETLICAAVLIMRTCSLATEIGNKTRLVNAQGWIEKHWFLRNAKLWKTDQIWRYHSMENSVNYQWVPKIWLVSVRLQNSQRCGGGEGFASWDQLLCTSSLLHFW